jgi:hypothetical protein
MDFFKSFFKREKTQKITAFESILRALSNDPNLAETMIHDAKPSDRIVIAFCLACLHGGYTITAEIRHSLENRPTLQGKLSSNQFQFDAVVQEVIAFVFFSVMAEFQQATDNNKSGRIAALKEARYIAESLTEQYTTSQTPEYIKSRIASYSMALYKGENLFEEAANKIITGISIGANGASVDNLIALALIQHALASDMLFAIKRGISQLYADWQSNPEWY